MNAQHIRKVEPLDADVPANQAGVPAEGLRMLVEYGVYTRAQIEASLGLSEGYFPKVRAGPCLWLGRQQKIWSRHPQH